MTYAEHFNPRATPQTEQADPKQAQNSAGGFSFAVDRWKRLERFLILGNSGGSYYATERELTRENGAAVVECCNEDPARAVRTIVEISEAGRAPKNDPAVFALALAAAHPKAAREALAALPRVCRIGTHLFQFVDAVDKFRGWGPALRRGVAAWYLSRTPEQLAYQVTKYQQREKWSHRDVLRLSHAAQTEALAPVFRWIVGAGADERVVSGSEKKQRAARGYGSVGTMPFLQAFDELKKADLKRSIELVRENGFTHEMIQTQHKNSTEMWEALLDSGMPLTAMIRSLAKMTAVGLLKPLSPAVARVCERLTDEDALRKARVHPIQMLSALKVYQQGHGERGSLKWSPVPQIVDALDAGFYAAFGAVETTGKPHLLALDVSGSMGGGVIAGIPGLTPRDVSAALAMVTMRTEARYYCFGFSHRFVDLGLTPRMRLDDVLHKISGLPFEATNCSLPMEWAQANKVDAEIFHVYTDSETYAGRLHPHQALQKYRQARGLPAKLAVLGMVSNGFTIADPNDAGMLDVVGCDTATPNVLADFASSTVAPRDGTASASTVPESYMSDGPWQGQFESRG
jgi:60 kDa SS-A/Ro ribonucleoprotein